MGDFYLNLIIVACLSLISLTPYLIWPSHKNLPGHLEVGFVLLAYIIAGLKTPIFNNYNTQLKILYSEIMFLGTLFYVIGAVLGFKLRIPLTIRVINSLDNPVNAKFYKKITFLSCLTISMIAISFAYMGFIPALAQDPLAAKFFKGSYHEKYIKIAFFYRSAFVLITLLTPICLAVWLENRRSWKFLILFLIQIFLLSLTLNRGIAITGALSVVGIILSKNRIGAFIFIMLMIFSTSIGSVVYYIIGTVLDNQQYVGIYNNDTIWSLLASGAPDIADQLNFLDKFSHSPEFTYGRTFLGGLVPNNYYWNPSVWSLYILNSNPDISQVSSGGLRLPVPLWGYVSFDFFGAAMLPLISGGFLGIFLNIYKKTRYSIINSTISLLFFLYIGKMAYDFYESSIYAIPSTVLLLYITNFRILRRKRYD